MQEVRRNAILIQIKLLRNVAGGLMDSMEFGNQSLMEKSKFVERWVILISKMSLGLIIRQSCVHQALKDAQIVLVMRTQSVYRTQAIARSHPLNLFKRLKFQVFNRILLTKSQTERSKVAILLRAKLLEITFHKIYSHWKTKCAQSPSWDKPFLVNNSTGFKGTYLLNARLTLKLKRSTMTDIST